MIDIREVSEDDDKYERGERMMIIITYMMIGDNDDEGNDDSDRISEC